MMSPLQIERSLSVHSGTTGKDVFIFEKVGGEKDNGMKGRSSSMFCLLLITLNNVSCLENYEFSMS